MHDSNEEINVYHLFLCFLSVKLSVFTCFESRRFFESRHNLNNFQQDSRKIKGKSLINFEHGFGKSSRSACEFFQPSYINFSLKYDRICGYAVEKCSDWPPTSSEQQQFIRQIITLKISASKQISNQGRLCELQIGSCSHILGMHMLSSCGPPLRCTPGDDLAVYSLPSRWMLSWRTIEHHPISLCFVYVVVVKRKWPFCCSATRLTSPVHFSSMNQRVDIKSALPSVIAD